MIPRLCLIAATACTSPRVGDEPSACANGSTSPACGTVRDDLVGKVLAIGLTNNSGFTPASAPVVHLAFNEAPAGELAIVSVAVPDGSISVDGNGGSDWANVPTTDYALSIASDVLTADRNPAGLVATDHGIHAVRVASAYDATYIYFKLEWADATENRSRGRWTFTSTGWLRNQGPALGTVDTSITDPRLRTRPMDQDEDRAFLSFAKNIPDFAARNGCAGMCHLEDATVRAPIVENGINYYNGGGAMRTDAAGEKVDLWAWRAATTGGLRIADDNYFNCGPQDPTCGGFGKPGDGLPAERDTWTLPATELGGVCTPTAPPFKQADAARYPSADVSAIKQFFGNEWFEDDGAGACVSRGPSRRPASGGAADSLHEPGSPNIGERDAAAAMIEPTDVFAVGDTLPGYIHRNRTVDLDGSGGCQRCSVAARASFRAGTWTLEMQRTLQAPEPDFDVDFTVNE